jgi:dTDP-4-dehydrorhamnose reductase
MDITDGDAVRTALGRIRPWALVNAAGYVRVDDAEADAATCMRANADGAAILASACADADVRLLTFSTDLVFDGAKKAPYAEDDPVAPLNVYGRSKTAAEERVATALPDALVVRTSAFFGPWDAHNFVTLGLAELAAARPLAADDETVVAPTYVPHLVDASLDLLIDGESGIWHLAGGDAVTWAELARRAAAAAGAPARRIVGVGRDQMRYRAPRPRFSALTSSRGLLMPSLEEGLACYAREREAH